MKKTTTKKTKKVAGIEDNSAFTGSYLATLNLKAFKKIYQGKGNSVKEALSNIVPLNAPKGTSILTITKDGISRQKILGSFQVMRLFSPSRFTKEVALKNISSLFNI